MPRRSLAMPGVCRASLVVGRGWVAPSAGRPVSGQPRTRPGTSNRPPGSAATARTNSGRSASSRTGGVPRSRRARARPAHAPGRPRPAAYRAWARSGPRRPGRGRRGWRRAAPGVRLDRAVGQGRDVRVGQGAARGERRGHRPYGFLVRPYVVRPPDPTVVDGGQFGEPCGGLRHRLVQPGGERRPQALDQTAARRGQRRAFAEDRQHGPGLPAPQRELEVGEERRGPAVGRPPGPPERGHPAKASAPCSSPMSGRGSSRQGAW